MGYMRHNAIVVVASGYAMDGAYGNPPVDVDTFRASLPEPWRHLVIGPVPAVMNRYVTFVFAPDGSKEGWETSDEGDRYRAAFLDLFSFTYPDGSSPYDVLVVDARFGGDEPGYSEDELIVNTRHSTWRNP